MCHTFDMNIWDVYTHIFATYKSCITEKKQGLPHCKYKSNSTMLNGHTDPNCYIYMPEHNQMQHVVLMLLPSIYQKQI